MTVALGKGVPDLTIPLPTRDWVDVGANRVVFESSIVEYVPCMKAGNGNETHHERGESGSGNIHVGHLLA